MNDTLAFEEIEIDRPGRIVRKRSSAVDLSDLGFDLLCYLAERAPEPVSNQELAEQVWGQAYVSDQTVAQRIAMIRRALGDEASDPRFIRTVRGKGYAFIARREERASSSKTGGRRNPGARKLAIGGAIAFGILALAGGAMWQAVPRPPLLLDPQTGAIRLDNDQATLMPPALAEVSGRSVMIAGLTDWALVKGNPEVLGVLCSLKSDRSQFTSAIDTDLQAYLDDPAKDADCRTAIKANSPEQDVGP